MAKNIKRRANYLDNLETAYRMIAQLTGTSVDEARSQLEEFGLRNDPAVQAMPEAEREQFIATQKADFADYMSKVNPVPVEPVFEEQISIEAPVEKQAGAVVGARRSAAVGIASSSAPDEAAILNMEKLASDPDASQAEKDYYLGEVNRMRRQKADAEAAAQNAAVQKPPMQAAPAPIVPAIAPGVGITTSGALSMFNSPENLKRISDLLSKADSGASVESLLEEIRLSTGLDKEAFWKALGDLNKTAGENPFVDKEGDESGDDKEEKKEDKKDDKPKGGNPFEDGDDSADEDEDEDEDESESEGSEGESKSETKEKSEPSESKEEPEEKKSKSEIKREKKNEKDEAKLLKQMLSLGEKLLKLEKGEDEAHIAELKNAIEILKEFSKEEKEEDLATDAPSDDMAVMEKTGPDLPPAMEGLAVPLPSPSMEGEDGVKVIDLAPPALELAAAKTSPEAQKFIHEKMRKMHKEPGKKNPKQDIAIALNMAREKGMKVPDAPAKKKASGFKKYDRVWRAADMAEGFETIGDEPGRIIDFGNDKAIVDWGHEDGIPTEESLDSLVLASAAGVDSGMFALPKQSAWLEVEPMNPVAGVMGGAAAVEMVLRETSLYDILARNAKENEVKPDSIIHSASGKTGTILQRLAGGQIRIAVEGKELVVWPYEVEQPR